MKCSTNNIVTVMSRNSTKLCQDCGSTCNADGSCEECSLVSEDIVEASEFDKFMDSILIKEHKTKKVDATEDTPQRTLAKRYRELPQNRTRFIKK